MFRNDLVETKGVVMKVFVASEALQDTICPQVDSSNARVKLHHHLGVVSKTHCSTLLLAGDDLRLGGALNSLSLALELL